MDWFTAIGFVVSLLVNLWQADTNGTLEAERDQYKSIAVECSVSKKEQHQLDNIASDKEAQRDADIRGIIARQKLDPRDINQNDDSGGCPNLRDALRKISIRGESRARDGRDYGMRSGRRIEAKD